MTAAAMRATLPVWGHRDPVEVDDLAAVLGLRSAIESAVQGDDEMADRLEGVLDLVPAARTLLVVARSAAGSRPCGREWLRWPDGSRRGESPLPRPSHAEVAIPVRYDGADLDEVAALTGLAGSRWSPPTPGSPWTVGFAGRTRLRLPRRRRPAAGGAAAQRATHQRARRGRGARRAVQRDLPPFVARRLAGDRPHRRTPVGPRPGASRAAAPGRPRALRRPRRRGVSPAAAPHASHPTSAARRLRGARGRGGGAARRWSRTSAVRAWPRSASAVRRGRPRRLHPRRAAARPGPGAAPPWRSCWAGSRCGPRQRHGGAHRCPGPATVDGRPVGPCRAVPRAPRRHAAARPARLSGLRTYVACAAASTSPRCSDPVPPTPCPDGPHAAPDGDLLPVGHARRRAHRRRRTGGGRPQLGRRRCELPRAPPRLARRSRRAGDRPVAGLAAQ